jgi:hypothetical protein
LSKCKYSTGNSCNLASSEESRKAPTVFALFM